MTYILLFLLIFKHQSNDIKTTATKLAINQT